MNRRVEKEQGRMTSCPGRWAPLRCLTPPGRPRLGQTHLLGHSSRGCHTGSQHHEKMRKASPPGMPAWGWGLTPHNRDCVGSPLPLPRLGIGCPADSGGILSVPDDATTAGTQRTNGTVPLALPPQVPCACPLPPAPRNCQDALCCSGLAYPQTSLTSSPVQFFVPGTPGRC